MNYLLILYAATYGIGISVPVLEKFETREQCEMVARHIIKAHGYYKDSECLYIGKDAKNDPTTSR